MRSYRGLLLALASVTVASCSNTDSPSAPRVESAVLAVATVPSVGGVPGFHFDPPLAPGASTSGAAFDDGLLDLLTVEICEWDGDACVQPVVRRFTANDGLGINGKRYKANWNTQGDHLDATRNYRIRVLASGSEIGYSNIDVVDPSDNDPTGHADKPRIVAGSTLPISFTIEVGAGERIGSDGGVIELAGGLVKLDIPAGALAGDVFITAVPASEIPATPSPFVPGTAWDFGPNGLVFAKPIFMTIAYDPALLPPGTVESELRIHHLVGGTYHQLNAGLVDVVNHTVSAEAGGFSIFVVFPRNPLNPEDVEPPVVQSIEMFDPRTGTFGNTANLDVSAGDATLTTRVMLTDNITGVTLVDIRYISPSGNQYRFPCETSAPPTSGSDTNGTWDCTATIPQYAEPGTWHANYFSFWDRINNIRWFYNQAGGFCDQNGTTCLSPPTIVITSDPADTQQPTLQSFEVSLDVTPRVFGSSVSVDASTGPHVVEFGFGARDDLSGVGSPFPYDYFLLTLRRPNGQATGYTYCVKTQGTTLDGFWECPITIPAGAEMGTWTIASMRVPDRAGNGGYDGRGDFRPNGAGQLCNNLGNCVTPPTVEVTSSGDSNPPELQTLSITSSLSDVTTTLGMTDDITGVSYIYVRYYSAATTQYQGCLASRTAGTDTNGTFSCTISFPTTAARGEWSITLQAYDKAGNFRYYYRRVSDGFLCYYDAASQTEVCQDFGDTDLNLN